MPLPRPCRRCEKRFVPATKDTKLCENCFVKARFGNHTTPLSHYKKEPLERINKMSYNTKIKLTKYKDCLRRVNGCVLRRSEIVRLLGLSPSSDITSLLVFREGWLKKIPRKYLYRVVIDE